MNIKVILENDKENEFGPSGQRSGRFKKQHTTGKCTAGDAEARRGTGGIWIYKCLFTTTTQSLKDVFLRSKNGERGGFGNYECILTSAIRCVLRSV